MTQYEQLADEIHALIRSGSLRVGDRLPSVRMCSERRKISQSTVFQAYYLLESRGVVQARARSGYYVTPRAQEPLKCPETSRPPLETQTVAINDLVVEILNLSRRPEVIPLGSAFPDPAWFPLDRLARSLGAAMRRLPPRKLIEDLTTGHLRLRQQIAQRYAVDGIHAEVDEIVITNGAMDALNLSLQAVTEPGDLVLVESPTFYASLQAIERLKLRALPLPTSPTEGVDLAAMEAALASGQVRACWFMPTFQNPVGALAPEPHKQAMAELLARYQVPLIEDDVYGDLYAGAHKPRPIKAFDKQGWVIHCASFSKSLAPGYRVGWAAAGRWTRAVERLKVMSSLSASVPPQAAISDYLAQGGYDLHLRRLRQTLALQRDVMMDAIAESFPPGTRVTRPQGGYFLWLELAPHIDAIALMRQALQAGVSLMPGQLFSADRRFSHCIRLNFGAAPAHEITRATHILGALVRGWAAGRQG
ncbi:PLP-dependent aminotransferase family protein [Acidovorax sp. FJL06]|uniref:aminotransferase-like domain-containing protein n=1 Tax=Acidovorax sp. FJL06 TaxID=2153365 RepID=UPI000F589F56|nr:PLP-dependent aminotransferase family protein [Acidovorax sp. FJL06]RQO81578.1 GntR family transcriptional regulator [Acidovorax sp. FJL06]